MSAHYSAPDEKYPSQKPACLRDCKRKAERTGAHHVVRQDGDTRPHGGLVRGRSCGGGSDGKERGGMEEGNAAVAIRFIVVLVIMGRSVFVVVAVLVLRRVCEE